MDTAAAKATVVIDAHGLPYLNAKLPVAAGSATCSAG